MLAAGWPVPQAGEPLQRGKGVALVLSGVTVIAWREAGEQWKAWSPRLVSVAYKPVAERGTVLMCCRVMHQHEQPIEQRKTSSMMIFSRHCTIRPVLCYPWGLQRLSRVQRSRGEMLTPGTMCVVHMGTESQIML